MLKYQIEEHLKRHKKTRIMLTEIENNLPANSEYKAYAKIIVDLLNEGVLTPVKSAGDNGQIPVLPLKFNIIRQILNKEVLHEIMTFLLHKSQYFKLDYYLEHAPSEWIDDRDDIHCIYNYLEISGGYPKNFVSSQERSYEISGNEKWLDQCNGRQVLKRLKIYENMLINNQSTPAMFAINANRLNNTVHRHLIVENKATYYGLLDVLPISAFSTLIFGSGWQIIDSIRDFDRQFPLEGSHQLYYFGDVDFEGIRIAKRLSEIKKLNLAIPFYNAVLSAPKSKGKANQKEDVTLCSWFSDCVPLAESKVAQLTKGYYWPQEALDEGKLQEIMENYIWT